MIGAEYFTKNLNLLAKGGKHISIATLSGYKTEIDLRKVMKDCLTIIGSTLRNRPLDEKQTLRDEILTHCWEGLKNGAIKPLIDSVYKWEDGQKAHEKMRSSAHKGKLVLDFMHG